MKSYSQILACALLLSFYSSQAQYYNPDSTAAAKKKHSTVYNFWDHVYFGGNFGGWYSKYYSYLILSPSMGYNITKSTSVGLNAAYIYMHYVYTNNYSYSSSIYGGGPFVRQFLTNWLFLYGEYNLYNGKVLYQNGSDIYATREWVPLPMAGIGIINRFGNKGGLTVTALYNFNYHQDKLPLYGSPLVIRIGVFF